MECPVCKGNKFYYEKVKAHYKVEAPEKCPNPNCINGRHVKGWTYTDPDYLKSTKEQHGKENKLLCAYCEGRGCRNCKHIGFFTNKCNKCEGKGYILKNYWDNDEYYRKKVCIACRDGNNSTKGSLAEIIEECIREERDGISNQENK